LIRTERAAGTPILSVGALPSFEKKGTWARIAGGGLRFGEARKKRTCSGYPPEKKEKELISSPKNK